MASIHAPQDLQPSCLCFSAHSIAHKLLINQMAPDRYFSVLINQLCATDSDYNWMGYSDTGNDKLQPTPSLADSLSLRPWKECEHSDWVWKMLEGGVFVSLDPILRTSFWSNLMPANSISGNVFILMGWFG